MVFGDDSDEAASPNFEDKDPLRDALREQIETMRHVGGFKIVVSSAELRAHLTKRAQFHAERTAEYKRQEQELREKAAQGTQALVAMMRGPLEGVHKALEGLGGSAMAMARYPGQPDAAAQIQALALGLVQKIGHHASQTATLTFFRDHLSKDDYLLSPQECLMREFIESALGSGYNYVHYQPPELGYQS